MCTLLDLQLHDSYHMSRLNVNNRKQNVIVALGLGLCYQTAATEDALWLQRSSYVNDFIRPIFAIELAYIFFIAALELFY